MKGIRNSRVTLSRIVIAKPLFGANEEANFSMIPVCPQKRHHALLISSEGFDVIAAAILKFAAKHIGLGHCKPRPFAGKQGDAGGSVADQRRAAFCPAIHSNLADTVEVDVTGILHCRENFGHSQPTSA